MKKNKSGWQTTEFWLTGLTVLGSISLSLQDVVPPKYAAVAASIATASYAIARGISKKKIS